MRQRRPVVADDINEMAVPTPQGPHRNVERHASLPSPQAAVGHREPCGKGDDSEGSQPPGEASFRPTHSETPVVTAFPTSFQRTPWPRRLSLAGAVHPLRNPWSRSAVPIPAVTPFPEAVVGEPDRRRGRDPDGRAALQGGYAITAPAKAP